MKSQQGGCGANLRPMRRWASPRVVAVIAAAAVILASTKVSAQDPVAAAEAAARAAANRVVEAQNRADRATKAFFEAESQLEQLKIELAEQERAVGGAKERVDALREGLREFLIDQYVGQTDQFSWFQMSDINQGLVQQELSTISANRRAVEIDEFRRAATDLQNLTNQLAARTVEQKRQVDYLATVKTNQAAEVDKLAKEKVAFEAALAKTRADVAERIRQETLRQQEENRRREEAAARARTTTTTTTTTRPRTNTGGNTTTTTPPPPPTPPTTRRNDNPVTVRLVTCPVQGGASYTDTYGQARGGGRLHIGVDLSAPVGTPVVAPVDGSVSYSSDGAGGLTFILSGTDGNFYYGAHLNSQGPASGSIKAGARIGTVGQTGNASVPHLHFEIHVGGRGNPINPYPSATQVC